MRAVSAASRSARLGVPLNLNLWAATVLIVPRIWTF
jgi:hypothetical protein